MDADTTPGMNRIAADMRRGQPSCGRDRYMLFRLLCLTNKLVEHIRFARPSRASQQHMMPLVHYLQRQLLIHTPIVPRFSLRSHGTKYYRTLIEDR